MYNSPFIKGYPPLGHYGPGLPHNRYYHGPSHGLYPGVSGPPPPPLRKVVEDYSYGLNDAIGEGLTSVVFLGRHDPTGERAVVKVIDLKAITTEQAKQNLLGQIEVLRALDHPSIMTLKEVYTTANNCYIITQHCEQGDLERRFRRSGPLIEAEAISVMVDVISACRHLYQKKIIHRDLKSSNILLTQGRAKLADFGFAVSEEKVQERQQYNVGSPLYMPPQTLLNNVYSFKSDIFSLGVIFFQILYGFAPWESKTQSELVQKLLTKPLDFAGRNLSPETKEFIAKALEIDPKARLAPQEYSEQIDKLNRALRRLQPRSQPLLQSSSPAVSSNLDQLQKPSGEEEQASHSQ